MAICGGKGTFYSEKTESTLYIIFLIERGVLACNSVFKTYQCISNITI